jgi:PilZ domain-containing protein
MMGLESNYTAKTGDERRNAERMLLVYRTAKLIFGDYEILVVVRNVSNTGLAIRTFAPIDLPEHMHIELANGAIVPIRKEWQEDAQFGASFQMAVSLELFLSSPPPEQQAGRSLRSTVGLTANLRHNGRRQSVMVHDISIGGAKLEPERSLGISVNGHADLTLDGLGALEGEIRWSKGPLSGMQFSQSLSFSSLAEWTTQLAQRRMQSGPAPDNVDLASPH